MGATRAGAPSPWLTVAGIAATGATVAWFWPAMTIDWQPALALTQPWRWWSAAFVHWSAMHLLANLAGTVVVAALGVVGRLPPAAAWAWAVAWPLTQLGLLAQPALAHYGGLSGVLHAGVAVACVWLLCQETGRERRIAAAIAIGLLMKLAWERPWGEPLRHGGGWDIAIAPMAHATGAAAGVLCGLVAVAWQGSRGADRHGGRSPRPGRAAIASNPDSAREKPD